MWNSECEAIIPFCFGQGVDIGCGGRSINNKVIRVDANEAWDPDVIASGDNLPFEDDIFDYVVSIHSFEHFEDQIKTLKGWLRVIKSGGYINIVHPDVDYTKKQEPPENNPLLKRDPLYKHYFERNLHDFLEFLHTQRKLGFKIVTFGEAQKGWSFYVILQKI